MRLIRLAAALAVLLSPALAYAAGGTLSLSPQSGNYPLGAPFSIDVLADTGGQAVNAIEGELRYDPKALSVVNISITGSVLTSWATTPSFDGAQGTISFSGWAGEPFEGGGGRVMTITFIPLAATQSTVRFDSGAMLAADAQATNIITSMTSGSYTLRPQEVVPPPAPPPAPAAAPVISQPTDIQEGEHIIVKGTAAPDAQVIVFIQMDGRAASSSTVSSAADGSFVYAADEGAAAGVYFLWAEQIGPDGQPGPASPRQQFTVRSAQGAAVITAGIQLASAAVPYLAVLAAIAFGIAYLMHRRSLVP